MSVTSEQRMIDATAKNGTAIRLSEAIARDTDPALLDMIAELQSNPKVQKQDKQLWCTRLFIYPSQGAKRCHWTLQLLDVWTLLPSVEVRMTEPGGSLEDVRWHGNHWRGRNNAHREQTLHVDAHRAGRILREIVISAVRDGTL